MCCGNDNGIWNYGNHAGSDGHQLENMRPSDIVTMDSFENAILVHALYYYPQPVIPFAKSAFDSRMTIYMEDDTSQLFLLEIISCGRNAHDERFQYRRFSSKVLLYRGEKLVYRDNTCYEPGKMPMEGIGMYEGYTHMANLFMSKTNNIDEEKIWQVLDEEPEIDGGITHLATGDLVLRIFGYRAQKLQKVAEKSDMLPPLKS